LKCLSKLTKLGGIALAWSLTNGLAFPLNHYFIFLVLAITSVLCLLLTFKLDKNRVDGARQNSSEAKGLLQDWREKKKKQRALAESACNHPGD